MLKSILLGLLPSFLGVPVRRMLGARLEAGAKIGWLSFIRVRNLEMCRGAHIGTFSVVSGNRLYMGAGSAIRPLAFISTHTLILGEYAHIAPTAIIMGSMAPRSKLIVGDHSRIFPFCWIEPGEGVTIGKQVGVGGHGLIFTHGAWSDYLKGGPIAYGPVTIEDNVWLPWRVSVLANVTIGANSIVMSGSVVSRSIPPGTIAGGAPAKPIKQGGAIGLDENTRLQRALEILRDFATELTASGLTSKALHPNGSVINFGQRIAIDDDTGLERGDLLFLVTRHLTEVQKDGILLKGVSIVDYATVTLHIASSKPYIVRFSAFLRKYGIRLYVRRVDRVR